jgi:hypothetical protein
LIFICVASVDEYLSLDLYAGNPAVMFALLVAIAHKYGCPYPLPSNVVIIMVRREVCVFHLAFFSMSAAYACSVSLKVLFPCR